jgi:hypothetical protein
MKIITKTLVLISLLSLSAFAQTKPKAPAKPPNTKTAEKKAVASSAKPPVKTNKTPEIKSNAKPIVKPESKPATGSNAAKEAETWVKPTIFKGEIDGNTYTNKIYNFAITLPEDWVLPGDEFEQVARGQGVNLSMETPKAVDPKIQPKLNQMQSNVSVLLNAFKYETGTDKNAFLRVSVEDLQYLPQVKDAVDYFDLMRETYKNIKLPADFKYSETQAERLGKWQFGFLDTSNKAGKKRMYATVRNGYALMFTLTYKNEEDLAALRNILAAGNFRLK